MCSSAVVDGINHVIIFLYDFSLTRFFLLVCNCYFDDILHRQIYIFTSPHELVSILHITYIIPLTTICMHLHFSLPSFSGVSQVNSMMLPASFVLVLPQSIPVSAIILEKITSLTSKLMRHLYTFYSVYFINQNANALILGNPKIRQIYCCTQWFLSEASADKKMFPLTPKNVFLYFHLIIVISSHRARKKRLVRRYRECVPERYFKAHVQTERHM